MRLSVAVPRIAENLVGSLVMTSLSAVVVLSGIRPWPKPVLDIDTVSFVDGEGSTVHVITFSRKVKNFWSDPRFRLARSNYDVASCSSSRTFTVIGDDRARTDFYNEIATAMSCEVGLVSFFHR